MYKIIMTNPAANDLTNAVLYIADELDNKSAAIDLMNEAENLIHSLSDMPGRFPIVNDNILAQQGIRMMKIKHYLAFYSIREETKTVTVLCFLYAKRDWRNILKI